MQTYHPFAFLITRIGWLLTFSHHNSSPLFYTLCGGTPPYFHRTTANWGVTNTVRSIFNNWNKLNRYPFSPRRSIQVENDMTPRGWCHEKTFIRYLANHPSVRRPIPRATAGWVKCSSGNTAEDSLAKRTTTTTRSGLNAWMRMTKAATTQHKQQQVGWTSFLALSRELGICFHPIEPFENVCLHLISLLFFVNSHRGQE